MTLRFWSSVLVFLSSYSPLALILVVKDLREDTFLPQHSLFVIILLIVAVVSVLAIIIAAKSIKSGLPVKISKVSNRSADMFAYTIPYMISFYKFDLGDWKTIACLTIFLLLMFVISYRTQNMFVNPVLAIMGFGLYDCQFTDGGNERQGLLISREPFEGGDICSIERLSNFLYFVGNVQRKGEAEWPLNQI